MNGPLTVRRAIGLAVGTTLLLLSPIADAAPAKQEGAPVSATGSARPWFYQHSDLPMDTAWHFGVLPNGLRYAVRHNDVPARQVSIRVRVDVGSLMERPDEAGFAHFIEHLTFRGSREVPDGESKRIWQRLGATFGSDSNAQTTPTGTTYALDLPSATQAGLNESFKILAGMLAEPNIVPEAVNAERMVVMAERREGLSPGTSVGDQTRAFYYAGQPLADHSPIGTEASLENATTAGLKAFHDRWYRPDRTVIAVSGDADPAALEAMIRANFGGWKPTGPETPSPDFGKPDPKAPKTKVIVEPAVPFTVGLAYLRPWTFNEDTVAFNEGRLADELALQLINRRLGLAASQGASFLDAQVGQDDTSRSVNATYVNIVPVGKDWEKALKDVRAIIEDAKASPPSQADIDREFASMQAAYAAYVASASIESSARQAEMLVGAVDIRETVVTPQTQLDILRSARNLMTPAKILASTRRMFNGTAVRALLSLKADEPNAKARLAAAFEAPVKPAANVRVDATPVTMDALPALPPPGKVVSRVPLGFPGIEKITFENGVTLLLTANKAEPGKVRIHVRFGNGRASFAPNEDPQLWAAPFALPASGIGNLDQNALIALTNGRQLSLNFSIGDDAFEMDSVSSPTDYKDQLRLFAEKLAYPRWDAAPLNRAKAALAAGYDPVPSSAGEAFDRDLGWLLSDKDPRLAPQTPDKAAGLTLDKFKALWAPRLASGPIEVMVFGDLNADEAISAVAATFGALPARKPVPAPQANSEVRFPAPVRSPVLLTHNGQSQQAAAAIAWPTGGGVANIKESRQLEILSRIISDRLFERLRSVDGAAYTPVASSSWPLSSDSGGYLLVQSQLKPDRLPYFYGLVTDIAHDLATNPVSQDELDRQIEPVRQLIGRASSSNAFWLNQLEGASTDPTRLAAARSLAQDLLTVTPEQLRALAARYLQPDKAWAAMALAQGVDAPKIVLGDGKPGAPAVAANSLAAAQR